MSSAINTSSGIPLESVQALDSGKLSQHLFKVPFDEVVKMKEEELEMRYREIANAEDNPVNDVYAYIKRGDEIIATLYNNGGMETSNATGSNPSHNLPMRGKNGEISGPALALVRAEFVAKTLGGNIEITDTAQTQDTYDNTLKPYSYINYAAMKNDPKYLELQNFIANKNTYESETVDDYLARLLNT